MIENNRVSFYHCVVCASTDGFWLPVWYLQTLLLLQSTKNVILQKIYTERKTYTLGQEHICRHCLGEIRLKMKFIIFINVLFMMLYVFKCSTYTRLCFRYGSYLWYYYLHLFLHTQHDFHITWYLSNWPVKHGFHGAPEFIPFFGFALVNLFLILIFCVVFCRFSFCFVLFFAILLSVLLRLTNYIFKAFVIKYVYEYYTKYPIESIMYSVLHFINKISVSNKLANIFGLHGATF